jgi:hypothetical protein
VGVLLSASSGRAGPCLWAFSFLVFGSWALLVRALLARALLVRAFLVLGIAGPGRG